MTSDLAYRYTTAKPLAEAVASIEKAAADNGFRVLHVHNVQQTLQEKGFDIPGYSIVEVCNAKFAHQVLTKEKQVGMMLPCRIAVYEEQGAVTLLLMKPSIIGEMMPDAGLGTIPMEVENILVKVVQEALR